MEVLRSQKIRAPEPFDLTDLRPATCPNCRTPMCYSASEMDKTYTEIRQVMFICSCGLTSDQMIVAAV